MINHRLLSVPFSMFLSNFGRKCPIRVMHFSTFRCNLHCQYCGIWKTPKKEMSTEEAKGAMKEFAHMGTIFWTFTGGEPLLRQDIGELVSYARKLFPIVTLTTNGLLLKERLNEVDEVNYFTVSLDGPRAVTDRFRGKGTFDKAIDSIKAARKNGNDIVINAVISKANTKNNFLGIRKIIGLTSDLGCKLNFSVLYEDQFNRGMVESTFPTNEEKVKALSLIKSFKQLKPNLIMFSDPCIERLKNPRPWKKCYAGLLFCDLFPDGTVIPCLFKEKQGVNGLNHGFVKAFKGLLINKNCGCSSTCYTELNCIFSLKPKSVVENLFKYLNLIR